MIRAYDRIHGAGLQEGELPRERCVQNVDLHCCLVFARLAIDILLILVFGEKENDYDRSCADMMLRPSLLQKLRHL